MWHFSPMDRAEVIRTLNAHRSRLNARGVISLSLFGSTARGEAVSGSDVDVAVRLSDSFSSGGFDYFGKLEELRLELSDLLGVEVDIVAEPARNPRLREAIERDRIVAFQ